LEYDNQQISHLSTDSKFNTIFPTENVGRATFKGLEVDLQARPLSHTLLSADVQYTTASTTASCITRPQQRRREQRTGCVNGAAPGATYTVDCSGKQPPYAPRWTLSASAEQTMPMPNSASLSAVRGSIIKPDLTALEFLPVEEQPVIRCGISI